jgi:predicted amidohydrolase
LIGRINETRPGGTVQRMRAAAVQLTATADKAANLETAGRLVDDAADAGAQLVVLPEMFNCLGTGAELAAGAEPLDGPTAQWASAAAARRGITLVAGTFVEAGATPADRRRNTCTVWGPDGQRLAVYRKIHLFDVSVPGAEYQESSVIEPGDEVVVAATPAGPIGLTVCYDVRFPELYRLVTLGGAAIVTVPAAFTARTGPPHWELLLRARAVENQVFVVAAGQVGATNENLRWHGHSMIIDPWGTVLAEAGGSAEDPDGKGSVIVADLDPAEQARVRSVLPSLANRRPSAYRWPDAAT